MVGTETKLSGFLLVNKPADHTSHDVVQRLRKIIGQRRVGHTGTLDPQATGLMVVCIGSATKIARFVSDLGKTYRAEITLGRTSETYDSEGIDMTKPEADVSGIDRDQIDTVLAEFTGLIRQKVPAFSAVRVDGQRLYKAARKGESVDTPERDVEIKNITVHRYKAPVLEIEVSCSKGTYIRSLAHDVGERLGCGAYLSRLERSGVGHLKLKDALTLDEIEKAFASKTLSRHLLEFDAVLDLAAIEVSDEFAQYVETGRTPSREDILGTRGEFRPGDKVFLKNNIGRVLAVGTAGFSSEARAESNDSYGSFKYIRVLN